MNVHTLVRIGIILLFVTTVACDRDSLSEKLTEPKVSEAEFQTGDFALTVDTMPKIIGGLQAIQQRIRYPELAIRAGIEGTVYVHAYVDMEGNVARTEILRDPGAGLGEAAADAVARTQFEPGKHQGEPVPVRVSIPVHFRLSSSE
jgi:periplasmic protein TonB